MADLSTFLNSGAVKLAPQLTGFPTRTGVSIPATIVTGIDVSSGATVLSLAGKYAVGIITLSDITNGTNITVNLAIDGETIWNETLATSGTNLALLGAADAPEFIKVNSSLTLTITQAGETDLTISYLARPIV
jgi:hypothetical protein